jgi:hypothetical protein
MSLPMSCSSLYHPIGLVAVGTKYGEIIILRHIYDYLRSFYANDGSLAVANGKESIITRSHLVWHSHAVKSLAFSFDGRILYSGGEESVVVIWNLAKSSHSFIPRVGAPVGHLVVFQ